jgi:hypothetical protein
VGCQGGGAAAATHTSSQLICPMRSAAPAQYCCQPCIACAEEEEDSGEDFQEAKPKARPAAKKPAAAAAGAVAKKPAPARDRAFEDGGLDAGGEPALVVCLLPRLLGHVMCLPVVDRLCWLCICPRRAPSRSMSVPACWLCCR